MGIFEDFLRRGKNYNNKDGVEYYEDTHDKDGNYRSNSAAPRTAPPLNYQYGAPQQPAQQHRPLQQPYNAQQQTQQVQQPQQQLYSSAQYQASQFNAVKNNQVMQIPTLANLVNNRNYQNVVIYEPNTPEDVQMLIDYLKRREPAIINLDKVDDTKSQRILDFVSGAIYALNGSVHRISGNIFLLSPEGVAITAPIENAGF